MSPWWHILPPIQQRPCESSLNWNHENIVKTVIQFLQAMCFLDAANLLEDVKAKHPRPGATTQAAVLLELTVGGGERHNPWSTAQWGFT